MHESIRRVAKDGPYGEGGRAQSQGSVQEHNDVADDHNLGICVGALAQLLLKTDFGIEAQTQTSLMSFVRYKLKVILHLIFKVHSALLFWGTLGVVLHNPGDDECFRVQDGFVDTTEEKMRVERLLESGQTLRRIVDTLQ